MKTFARTGVVRLYSCMWPAASEYIPELSLYLIPCVAHQPSLKVAHLLGVASHDQASTRQRLPFVDSVRNMVGSISSSLIPSLCETRASGKAWKNRAVARRICISAR